MGKVQHSVWAHLPWWVIAGSVTAVGLGAASLVYFQEMGKEKKARPYIISHYPSAETEPPVKITDHSDIVLEPIPYYPPDPSTEDPNLAPLPEDWEKAPISEETLYGGGEESESLVPKGRPDGEFVLIDPTVNPFSSIGTGSSSGVGGKPPWGDPRGGGRTRGIGIKDFFGTTPRIRGIPVNEALEGLK